jgi:hypothetical protein
MASVTTATPAGLHLVPGLTRSEWEAAAAEERRRAARERSMASHPAGRRRTPAGTGPEVSSAPARPVAVAGVRER